VYQEQHHSDAFGIALRATQGLEPAPHLLDRPCNWCVAIGRSRIVQHELRRDVEQCCARGHVRRRV
jgi:hypothetical protein